MMFGPAVPEDQKTPFMFALSEAELTQDVLSQAYMPFTYMQHNMMNLRNTYHRDTLYK